ncbi:MAG TPA: hypothetical protein VJT49_23440 [Amycolatopsis sp.]|uniref:hypothetical protein n=1 Tax=Amycolatopsis sp. TaxID=37632 RepID=UPI002B470CB4|nr:hypothetical protein [Amycolatopsis sp.]HKS48010.1 hypothetical protein [Amycolatopsis sp.]
MRIMGRPRGLRGVTAVLAFCLLLAGCGSGPSQARAAVLIGDREISVDQVQQLIDRAVRTQPAAQQLAQQHKLDLIGREVVRQLVVHELIGEVAQREGLSADPAVVGQLVAALGQPQSATAADPSQLAGLIVARVRDHTESATDIALEQELGSKYYRNMSVTFDFTSISSDEGGDRRGQAFATAEQLAAAPNTAARRDNKFAAVQDPELASTALYGVPAGNVVVFQPPGGEAVWVVAVIRQRDFAGPVAVDGAVQASPDQLASIGIRLLQPYVAESGVKINPRYGVWDPVSMSLAPNSGETTGLVLPVKGSVQP